MRYGFVLSGVGAMAASWVAPLAWAQCTTIDFEDYAVGTEITTQYEGVVFSAPPGSCGWPIYPIIVDPVGDTSSGTKALGIMVGCPDFSPDWLRMVFDVPQRYVTFTLGEEWSPGITFFVRAYNAGGALIYAKTHIPGEGIFHLVEVGGPEWPMMITRVEIESEVGLFETIDDLSFNHDPTPPTAQIDSPEWSDCLCAPSVTVNGIACDFDGEYGKDTLEYRPRTGGEWTLIGSYTTPVCESGYLYTWDLDDVPHGWHNLRLTVENACGLSSSDIVSVYVDQTFDTVKIDFPQDAEILCGEVDILGTVNDGCGKCFDYYTVTYKPSGSDWMPVDPSQPEYDKIVINGRLAVWDTTKLPDGKYGLRVQGWDDCGNTEYKTVTVFVQASACGCLGDLDDSGEVDVLDLLTVLSHWGPCP